MLVFIIKASLILFPVLLVLIIVLLPNGAYGNDEADLRRKGDTHGRNRTAILVLGDIGRSPRMQNHTISMLTKKVAVDLIGYVDSELHPRLIGREHLTVHPIAKAPVLLGGEGKLTFFINAPLKVLWQVWELWMILGHQTKPAKWLLVQNPPSIPVLLVVSIICWYRRTNLAVDWHNFGYTILALKLGQSHPFVMLSKLYEHHFSKYADVNLTVSEAMSKQLKREFKISGSILRLYDRPTSDFKPLGDALRLDFIKHIDLPSAQQSLLQKGKMKVLVSSTSWTPDEDFSILLDALVGYSRAATTTHPQLPELLVVITGKGPQKEQYLRKIVKMEKGDELEMVMIKTAWLPQGDYAKLLASADLGVSLHQSSSGVDLPMKVVDMFGAGLPVVGWSHYESWPELVKEGVNGRGFKSTSELQDVLVELFGDNGKKLESLRNGVIAESSHHWQDEWEDVVGRTFGYIEG